MKEGRVQLSVVHSMQDMLLSQAIRMCASARPRVMTTYQPERVFLQWSFSHVVAQQPRSPLSQSASGYPATADMPLFQEATLWGGG